MSNRWGSLQNRLSITADLLVQRTTIKKYPKQQLLNVDLLLYYLTQLYDKTFQRHWFPVTYIYGRNKIEFLQRLASTRFFNRVKVLFGVTTCEELRNKFIIFKNEYSRGYSNSFEKIPDIKYHIKPEEICSMP